MELSEAKSNVRQLAGVKFTDVIMKVDYKKLNFTGAITGKIWEVLIQQIMNREYGETIVSVVR